MSITSASATRYGLALAIVAASALFIDTPPQAYATETQAVIVEADVEGACQTTATPLIFAPVVTTGKLNLYAGLGPDTAVIDLQLVEGLDELCDTIGGYVTFTETGFSDPLLDWDYYCDDNEWLTPSDGVYTCQTGSSSQSVGIEVEALVGATLGATDSNTITFTLIAVTDG